MFCYFQVYRKVIQLYIKTYFFFKFYFMLLQNIEYSSLYYTVGNCWLSILYVVMYIY